jgi:hypothetical protein
MYKLGCNLFSSILIEGRAPAIYIFLKKNKVEQDRHVIQLLLKMRLQNGRKKI